MPLSALLAAPLPPTDGLAVCCIGAGYVGGPTSAVLALKNPRVRVSVVDNWAERIAAWNSEVLPIFEPGLDGVVSAAKAQKNLVFSTDVDGEVRNADVIFVSVNTPTKTFGIGAGFASDVTHVELCARKIAAACSVGGRHDGKRRVIVEKSTVPVKTAETIRKVLLAASSREGDSSDASAVWCVLSSPEFLAEGTAIADLMSPARVLIGGDDTPSGRAGVRVLASLYSAWSTYTS
jgi:UDPglucose 6-dehydrogenase